MSTRSILLVEDNPDHEMLALLARKKSNTGGGYARLLQPGGQQLRA
jgi:hypothetical protein